MRRTAPRSVSRSHPQAATTLDRNAVLRLIAESAEPLTQGEIARALGAKGPQRRQLTQMLKEMEAEGLLPGDAVRIGGRKAERFDDEGGSPAPDDGSLPQLPHVTVVQVVRIDSDGEVLAEPVRWDRAGPPPQVLVSPGTAVRGALDVGDRALVKLAPLEGDSTVYAAEVLRVLDAAPGPVLGVVYRVPEGLRLQPTDRKAKSDFRIPQNESKGAEPGELVEATVLPQRRGGLAEVRVVRRVGRLGDDRAISLIAIHSHDIPTEFPPEALEQAERIQPPGPEGREDLRSLPLVTIDGADARDFDDAVWAEADGQGGFRLIVAIADVAAHVRPGSPLDVEAATRGNSVYFPDRVVPMLPERLSNDLCSLRPREDRACFVAHMRIDAEGHLVEHRFARAIMHSHARLTYEQAQAAIDGEPDETTGPLLDRVLRPLYAAWGALSKERAERGTLELDLPERRVVFGEDGRVADIVPRARLDSHRLIEDFMIAANVASAQTLLRHKMPGLYRVHAPPSVDRLFALSGVMETLGVTLPKSADLSTGQFRRMLEKAAPTVQAPLVSELVLRAQSQAAYAPGNIGHFGLALEAYAHFTSPIRRYADLVVHRALIAALKQGSDGLAQSPDELTALGGELSSAERRAAAAERDAGDRYAAAWLTRQRGHVFMARISGVTRFGLFLSLVDSGASGLIPISTLPQDFYDHDEHAHALVGRRYRRVFRLGALVKARLQDADVVTGSATFSLMSVEEDVLGDLSEAQARKGGGPAKGRGGGRPGAPPPRRPGGGSGKKKPGRTQPRKRR